MPSLLGQIATDIRNVLAATPDNSAPPGALLFSEVGIYDDLDSFVDLATGQLGKRLAGVILPPAADRLPPSNSDQEFCEAAEFAIAFSFTHKRTPGKDESGPTETMAAMADQIRARLMLDPSRGGRAGLVEWGGRMINGTSMEGDARLVTGVSNQAIYTAEFPVAVGWAAPVAI